MGQRGGKGHVVSRGVEAGPATLRNHRGKQARTRGAPRLATARTCALHVHQVGLAPVLLPEGGGPGGELLLQSGRAAPGVQGEAGATAAAAPQPVAEVDVDPQPLPPACLQPPVDSRRALLSVHPTNPLFPVCIHKVAPAHPAARPPTCSARYSLSSALKVLRIWVRLSRLPVLLSDRPVSPML